ncbi:hypothetical protein EVAR_14239_1 [Eumeta japonica]|uniref:Uncharacterized protein n=1 Tax=Eumeta variegata TaxID=151549 RepID=A0A4C1W8M4_EUMVA|nr:hypothetical protein EVAR_14239_1 [Eumeta japonica]
MPAGNHTYCGGQRGGRVIQITLSRFAHMRWAANEIMGLDFQPSTLFSLQRYNTKYRCQQCGDKVRNRGIKVLLDTEEAA